MPSPLALNHIKRQTFHYDCHNKGNLDFAVSDKKKIEIEIIRLNEEKKEVFLIIFHFNNKKAFL